MSVGADIATRGGERRLEARDEDWWRFSLTWHFYCPRTPDKGQRLPSFHNQVVPQIPHEHHRLVWAGSENLPWSNHLCSNRWRPFIRAIFTCQCKKHLFQISNASNIHGSKSLKCLFSLIWNVKYVFELYRGREQTNAWLISEYWLGN